VVQALVSHYVFHIIVNLVFHVDSVVCHGGILFCIAKRYYFLEKKGEKRLYYLVLSD